VVQDGKLSFRWTGKSTIILSVLVGALSGILGYVTSYVRTQAIQEMRIEQLEKEHEGLRVLVTSQMVGAQRFDDFRRLNERDHEEIKADIRELRNDLALSTEHRNGQAKRSLYSPNGFRSPMTSKVSGPEASR
jgi:hypothetical protein